MADFSQLSHDANLAYQSGRYSEAHLLFCQAASKAISLGAVCAWYENLVWAADAAFMFGQFPVAHRLLLEARLQEPEDRSDSAAHMLRAISVMVSLRWRPLLCRLLDQLTELRELAQVYPMSSADLETIAADIDFERGDYVLALEGYERAWQKYSGLGAIKEGLAYEALRCCLRLSNRQGARQWLVALEETASGYENFRKSASSERRLYLALMELRPYAELRQLLRALEDAAARIEGWDCTKERVRVFLLDPNGTDPERPGHPARQAVVQGCRNRWDVRLRFNRRLLFLDYRLAVLRFGADIPAVDDHYYSKNQTIPSRLKANVSHGDLAHRLRKARVAASWALIYAHKIDGWLECDWRQLEIKKRMQRIEEIAQAVEGGNL